MTPTASSRRSPATVNLPAVTSWFAKSSTRPSTSTRSLGAPSARAMEKLFAAIDAEAPVARKASFNFMGRVVEFMSSFSPRTLAYAGTAAAIALMVQAAVLTTVVVRDQGGQAPFQLASHEPRAMVRFTANATLADVTRFLDVNKAVVVNGPSRGRPVRNPADLTDGPEADFARAIERMKAETRIVEFIAIKNSSCSFEASALC